MQKRIKFVERDCSWFTFLSKNNSKNTTTDWRWLREGGML